jgi:formylglycine-generating enzyme required for sulfatase activity
MVHVTEARRPFRSGDLSGGHLGVILLAMTVALAGCGPAQGTPSTVTPQAFAPPVASASLAPTKLVTPTASAAPPTPSPTVRLATPPVRPTPPPAERGIDPWISPVDGMTLLPVPAGDFRMGTEKSFVGSQPDELPQHKVQMGAFWIDQTEVTQGMYQACVDDGACSPVSDDITAALGADPQLPAAGVTWFQASQYCAWAGRSLPTEAQWEKSARGTDGRLYPWGWVGAPKSGSSLRLNFCDASCPYAYKDSTLDDGFPGAAPVGQFPAGESPFGALDVAGNVWEWVADWYQSDAYQADRGADPQGPDSGLWKGIRGGSWLEPSWEGSVLPDRTANRGYLDPNSFRVDLGFRCAVP